MKKVVVAVVLLAALAGAAILVLDMLVDWIPPQSMTCTALAETSMRVRLFYESHKKLPQKISDLPVRGGYMNSTVDGWNHALLFEASENEIVLRSYGADGVAGGSGANADYETKITKLPLIGTLRVVTRKIDGGKETLLDKYPI